MAQRTRSARSFHPSATPCAAASSTLRSLGRPLTRFPRPCAPAPSQTHRNDTDVLLVSPDVTLGGPGSRGMTNMRTVIVPSLPAPGRADYRWSPWLLRKQRAALDLFRPDVVHVTTPDFLGHSAVWWAQQRGVCSVCTYHTAFDRYPQYYRAPWVRPFLQLLIGSFYNQCDLVAVPSYAAADQLVEAGVQRERMGFFPRGEASSSPAFSPRLIPLAAIPHDFRLS